MATEEKILTAEEAAILRGVSQEAVSAAPNGEPAPTHVQEDIDARDRSILAALDEMLSRRDNEVKKAPPPEENGLEKFCMGIVRKGAGIISLSLILIFMGIVVMCCLFSAEPDYLLPLKLSPVAAILLGIELFVYHVASGKRFRIHIPAIVISALIIVGCCAMAVILNNSYTESKEEYNNRSIAAQIYDSGYHELRHAADIEEIEVSVELNPDGTANKAGIDALTTDDIVVITVTFSGNYSDPEEFASECKTVIDAYRILGIPVTDFHFISDSRFNSFRLDVNGMFMQDYTEAQLVEKVNHVYIENYDYLEDLEDFTEEDIPTEEATQDASDL